MKNTKKQGRNDFIKVGSIFVPSPKDTFVIKDKFIRSGVDKGIENLTIESNSFEEQFHGKKEVPQEDRELSFYMVRKTVQFLVSSFGDIVSPTAESFLYEMFFILTTHEEILVSEGNNLFPAKDSNGSMRFVCLVNAKNVKINNEYRFKDGWLICSHPLDGVRSGDQIFTPLSL